MVDAEGRIARTKLPLLYLLTKPLISSSGNDVFFSLGAINFVLRPKTNIKVNGIVANNPMADAAGLV